MQKTLLQWVKKLFQKSHKREFKEFAEVSCFEEIVEVTVRN